MKDRDRVQFDDGPTRRIADEPRRDRDPGPRRDGVGPQGAALILELERLRQAFDHEDSDYVLTPKARRSARDGLHPPPGRARQPKRRQKGKVARAIDACLEQLGFTAARSAGRRIENVVEPNVTLQPGRRGIVTLEHPMSINASKPGPAHAPKPRSINTPKPRPADVPRPGSIYAPKPGPIGAPKSRPVDTPKPGSINAAKRRPIDAPKAGSIDALRPGLIDAPKPGPELHGLHDKRHSAPIDGLRLALPRPAGNVEPKVEPRTGAGQLVEKCRVGLNTGVAFLVNRDGLANNDNVLGETLTLRTGRSYENELRTGLRVLLVALVLGGGWTALMPLAGAVVVPGNLVVQSNVKTIQHPTGGVVAEIPVHNGMRVNVGDLLLRLDATQAQASLQMVSKQLDEVRARIARLIAERDGQPEPEIPVALADRLNESSVKSLLASEQTLFRARASARNSQKDLLQSRVAQLGEEIAGLEAQVVSKAKQLELISGELTGIQDLYDKRLVPLTRLTTLQRETARIEGERGQLISARRSFRS